MAEAVTPSGPAAVPIAAPTPQAPEPVAPDYRATKHKIKANGKELELSYDEVLTRAAKAEGADQTFRESAEARKKAADYEARFSRAKDETAENWDEIIDILGPAKARKFAERLIWEDMQFESLSPAEQRAYRDQLEMEELKAEKAEREKGEKETSAQRQKQESVEFIDKVLNDALDSIKADGIEFAADDIPELIERTVDEMLIYLDWCDDEEKAGRKVSKALTPKDVLLGIHKAREAKVSGQISKLTAKQLKSLLSKEQLSELRRDQIEDFYGSNPSRTSPAKQEKKASLFEADAIPAKNQGRRMSTQDAFDRLEKKAGLK